MTDVSLTVNGHTRSASVPPETTLLQLLREQFNLTGAKLGCDVGDCGACTVIVDGQAVNACLMLAGQADGRQVITIEGLASRDRLHPIQKAFENSGALQCGFCGPGVLMSAKALLDENLDPSTPEIRDALSGNLCRCTGYTKMIEAVQEAARLLREREPRPAHPRANLKVEGAMDDKTKVLERDRLDIGEPLTDVELRLPAVVPHEPFPIETLTPDARQQTRAVGQRATRPDGRLHGLGQTKYIDDLSFPGMLYARIKRAGIASARIKRIDTSAAEAMPGVMAVLTGKEIPVNSFGPSFQDQPVLVDEFVFHAGDGVAAVAAVTEQIANEALDKIVVEYEPLPAVLDPVAAMREDSPKVHAPNSNIYATKVIRKGDVEKGFAESDHIFEGRFSTQMIEHVSLEPHAAIADWDANGRLTV